MIHEHSMDMLNSIHQEEPSQSYGILNGEVTRNAYMDIRHIGIIRYFSFIMGINFFMVHRCICSSLIFLPRLNA